MGRIKVVTVRVGRLGDVSQSPAERQRHRVAVDHRIVELRPQVTVPDGERVGSLRLAVDPLPVVEGQEVDHLVALRIVVVRCGDGSYDRSPARRQGQVVIGLWAGEHCVVRQCEIPVAERCPVGEDRVVDPRRNVIAVVACERQRDGLVCREGRIRRGHGDRRALALGNSGRRDKHRLRPRRQCRYLGS